MATKARGRGFAPSGELRRPGETRMGMSNASKINGKETVESKIMVQKSGIGEVIGEGGNMIKKIQQDSGALVEFLIVKEEGHEDKVWQSITGHPEQVQAASAYIKKLIQSVPPSEDNIEKLCATMAAMDLSLPQSALETFASELKAVCKTAELLEKCAENLFQFALKSKWNAHAVAVFCNSHGDITVDQVKLRNLFFKKLQGRYLERNKAYQDLDKFLLDATFACEVFHHVRIAGTHLKVLSGPVLDYFGMLLTGASQKEVEVVIEQFPKCYNNLKDCEGFDDLLAKLRKQIISETTTVTVKAMMLELFELILTDWKNMNPSAKTFYETLSKPIVRICD